MDTQTPGLLQTVKPAVSSTTSITATLTTTILRSMIVVFVGGSGLTDTVTTVTDVASNVYIRACGTNAGSGGNVEIWYARNAQPTNSLTVTFSGSTNTKSVIVCECSGLSMSASVNDAVGTFTGTATSGSNTGIGVAVSTTNKTFSLYATSCSLLGAGASLSAGLFGGIVDQTTNASPAFAHGVDLIFSVGPNITGSRFFTPANNGAYDICVASFENRQGQAGPTVNLRPHPYQPGNAH